jgi:hypothetical protein
MKAKTLINNFGKKHRYLIKALSIEPLEISLTRRIWQICQRLQEFGIVECSENFASLSEKGREIVRNYESFLFQGVPDEKEAILKVLFKEYETNLLSRERREILFLRFLSGSPRGACEIRNAAMIIPALFEKKWIGEQNGLIFLTDAGIKALENCPPETNGEDPEEAFLSSPRIKRRKALLNKAEAFLTHYRKGLTYFEIGEIYNLTRERVRQILNITPNFGLYLKEYEQEKIERAKQKKSEAKIKNLKKSFGVRFPERVAEMWDREKNGDLNPAEIRLKGDVKIWLKCPKDGHSWQKKAGEIAKSWRVNGTSGCPVCSGRMKKPQKQKSVAEVYPALVEKYWNYEKNGELNLDPRKLTLGSNRQVWLKCSEDGHEWSTPLVQIVSQNWARNKTGCRVCSGTIGYPTGLWSKGLPLIEKFPEEVARYWDFRKNETNNLDPAVLTSGSNKAAWFKCPVDGFEWAINMWSISRCWKRGRNCCPRCRGKSFPLDRSLKAVYPQFVAEVWSRRKNKTLGLLPENLICETNREAWFKCPVDGTRWRSRINYLVNTFWRNGSSGCPKCSKAKNPI